MLPPLKNRIFFKFSEGKYGNCLWQRDFVSQNHRRVRDAAPYDLPLPLGEVPPKAAERALSVSFADSSPRGRAKKDGRQIPIDRSDPTKIPCHYLRQGIDDISRICFSICDCKRRGRLPHRLPSWPSVLRFPRRSSRIPAG